MYFEDQTLIDTTLSRRSLITAPESWTTGVIDASLIGARGAGTMRYRALNELQAGPQLIRDHLTLSWQQQIGLDWTFRLAPRAEYEHDRRFGRDIEGANAGASAHLRRSLGVSSGVELHALGDMARARGTGSEYVPDRNAVESGIAFERFPLEGSEWRAAYRYARRGYPDSVTRDHFEHGAEMEWRRDLAGSGIQLQGRATRRDALHPVDTRDRFLEADAGVVLRLWLGPSLDAEIGGGIETLTFDEPDTVVFFDYRIYRTFFFPRWSSGSWSIALGPRAEYLTSPQESEEYFESAAVLTVESLHRQSWWSLAPAVGRREYAETAGLPTVDDLARSSFTYLDLTAYADQRMPGQLQIRAMASVRSEWHDDSDGDTQSLYFSLDVRRLF